MYDRSAELYDAIYSFKNYEEEAAKLHELIQKHGRSMGNDLLEVACGTGGHITYLKDNYSVEGLDLSPKMLRLAKRKHPDVVFHRSDMVSFKLKKHFDAITCLFSAIGHLKLLLLDVKVFRPRVYSIVIDLFLCYAIEFSPPISFHSVHRNIRLIHV